MYDLNLDIPVFTDDYPREYARYPNLWQPPASRQPELYVVKVPEHWSQIASIVDYLSLLRGRIAWMIARWMDATDESQATVHQRLTIAWFEAVEGTIAPTPPPLREPDRRDVEPGRWRSAWSEALVVGNAAFLHRLPWLPLPAHPAVPIAPGEPGWRDLNEFHNAIDLETWLDSYRRLLT